VGVLVALIGLAVLAVFYARASHAGAPKDSLSFAIETPYVGQGVAKGTPVIMHGVKVGEVTDILSLPGGHVRLDATLQKRPVAGLTDAMGIDFRPSNYFGVTGINVFPAGGGQPLKNGTELKITPKGNFALQALLYRLGELTHDVLSQRLISVVDRATRYVDALTPLLETMITVSTTVTNVQTVSSQRLLRNATGINVALPGVMDALIDTGDQFLKSDLGTGYTKEGGDARNPYIPYYNDNMLKQYRSAQDLLVTNPDEYAYGRFKEWMRGASTDLFVKVGELESAHIAELFPIVDQIRVVASVVPKLVPSQDVTNTLREVRERLERMYAGSGDQRALRVRVILDSLPSVGGPLNLALGAAK
jgi:hypothetical protein